MVKWDACTFDPNTIMRWVECHPGTAGWVQAAGSVIALGIAIYLPYRERRNARRTQRSVLRKKTQISLRALLPSLILLEQHIAHGGIALGDAKIADKARSVEIHIPNDLKGDGIFFGQAYSAIQLTLLQFIGVVKLQNECISRLGGAKWDYDRTEICISLGKLNKDLGELISAAQTMKAKSDEFGE